MSNHLIWTVIFIFLINVDAFGENKLSIGGYYKNFFVYFRMPDKSITAQSINKKDFGLVSEQLRLKLNFTTGTGLSFESAYSFSPRIQDPLLYSTSVFKSIVYSSDYRVKDFDDLIYPKNKEDYTGSFGIYHNFDRFFMTYSASFGDLYVGRQVIAWGSARTINPTDVITPFNFDELDKEERVGVDALRLRIPIGLLQEFDAGYVFGKDFKWKESAFFVRTKLYKVKTDVSFMVLCFRENLMAGFDVARSVKGASVWFESAYVWTDFFSNKVIKINDDYLRLIVGADYAFTGNTYGFIEYHFNQAGSNHPENYLKNLGTIAYTEGSVYLVGEHYIVPGISYQITPLVTLTAQSLFNLSDGSFYIAPNYEYNISQNIYIAGGIYLSMKGFSFGSGTPEFGYYPDMFYSSFRIYF